MSRVLALLCAMVCVARAGENVDVLSYKIDATIHDDRLRCSVTLAAVARRPVRKLTLALAPTMKIESCKSGGKDLPFDRNGWDLVVEPGLPAGEFALVFEVAGRPYNRFQRGGFVRTNVCPDHAYVRSQYAWYPRRSDDPARYATTLTARADWRVLSAGVQKDTKHMDGRAVWRFEQEAPIRAIGLVAGDYAVVEDGSFSAMVAPGHEERGRALLKVASEAFAYYGGLYGAVALPGYTVVEMPAAFGKGSGYGEAGYVLVGAGAFDADTPWAGPLVAHEVSHTWWGHEVGFRHFASEMFATYATHRYVEHAEGEQAARAERSRFVARVLKAAPVPLDGIRNWGSGMDASVYRAHAYEKGAMLLHILSTEMGREALDAALQKLLARHRGKVIDYATVRTELGGSRWRWVFDQWGNPGIPRIREEHRVKKSGSSYVVKGHVFQEGTRRPFRMTVALRAVAGKDAVDHRVQVKKARTAFRFSCPFPPEEIVVDPSCDLVCELDAGNVDQAFKAATNPQLDDKAVLERTIADLRRILRAGAAKESECRAAIGRCLFRLRRFDEAKTALEAAIGMRDSGPFWRSWIHLRLGCIADVEKDRARATDHYGKVVAERRGSGYARRLAERFSESPFR